MSSARRVAIAGALALTAGPWTERLPARNPDGQNPSRSAVVTMTASDYEDRIRAAWYGQIAGTLMGFAFEHRAAATAIVDHVPDRFTVMPVDDDWYYEMVAVRAFERFGIDMTVEQLGEVDLKAYAGRTVTIRLIQRVLLGPEYASGNAYWRNLKLD